MGFCPERIPDRHWDEEVVAAVSREVSRTHALHFGSAPTGAETVWHDGLLVCVLEGALSEDERRLVERGRFDRVRAGRRAQHEVLEPRYRALVETLTGRAVRAYMSEVDPQGFAVEAFLLDD